MSVFQVAQRGFNLLATMTLALGGVTFGSVFFQEPDPSDKIDDGGFLMIAVVATVWYSWRGNGYGKSMVPIGIAAAAVLVQILGLVIERDDPKAFGDNIGGALYFGATLVILLIQWRRTALLVRRHGGSSASTAES